MRLIKQITPLSDEERALISKFQNRFRIDVCLFSVASSKLARKALFGFDSVDNTVCIFHCKRCFCVLTYSSETDVWCAHCKQKRNTATAEMGRCEEYRHPDYYIAWEKNTKGEGAAEKKRREILVSRTQDQVAA